MNSFMKYVALLSSLLYSCDVAKTAMINDKLNYDMNATCGSFSIKSFKFGSDLYLTFYSNTDSLIINTDSIEILNEKYVPVKIEKVIFYNSKGNKIKTPVNTINKGESFICIFGINVLPDSIVIVPKKDYIMCPKENLAFLKELKIKIGRK